MVVNVHVVARKHFFKISNKYEELLENLEEMSPEQMATEYVINISQKVNL